MGMARPLTRAQALKNRAFLTILRRTGNVRLACREVGLKYGTMQHRRRVHPAFALRWDAALVFFGAAVLKTEDGKKRGFRLTSGRLRLRGNDGLGKGHLSLPSPPEGGEGKKRYGPFRTAGGEPVLRRTRNGKLQVQRAQAGKLTREAEQAFLSALSSTCNMSLAAAAVGAAFNAFNRRRKADPAFAREVRLALAQGYEALELALIEGTLPASHEHSDWRHNDPPAMPPMSCNQALQLMYLHQKAALLVEEPTPMRRRRGESNAARRERLALMAEAREQRAREAFEVAEAERMERGEPAWGPAGEMVRLRLDPAAMLPDLAQVTGWSRADPTKRPHDPERALFGGWRMEDMRDELERREWEEPEGPTKRAEPRVRRS